MSGAAPTLPDTTSRPLRRPALLLALFVALTFSSPYFPKLGNPNEGVRVYMVKALVDDGTFAINDVVQRWGYVDDKSVVDGKLYSSKAPLSALLGAAAYALVRPFTGPLEQQALTRVCRIGGDALPVFVLVIAFAQLLWRRVRDPLTGDLIVVGLVVGTPVLAYSIVFSGHAIAAVASGILLLAATTAPDDDAVLTRAQMRMLAGLGFCGALAVGVEYPAFLGAAPLVSLGLWRARRHFARALACIAVGAALPVAATAVAHAAVFGARWRTGYSFLENTQYRAMHGHDFFGVGAPHGGQLLKSLISADVGLFFFSPLLLVGVGATLTALVPAVRRRPPCFAPGVIVVVTALFFLFIAGHRGWHGGWVVGPRYISELCGLLIVPAAFAFDALAQRRPTLSHVLLTALVTIGIAHSGLAGAFYPHLHETLKNPVHELVLPLVFRGFSPDTPALWLGASARDSCSMVVATLLLPLLIACARPTRAIDALGSVVFGSGVAVLLVLASPRWLPRTPPDVAALITRNQMSIWRPYSGNPWTEERDGPPTGPRRCFALDDAVCALQSLRSVGCVWDSQ